MEDYIELKHKTCGAVIKVTNKLDMSKIEQYRIKCPVCEKQVPFNEFIILKKREEKTIIPDLPQTPSGELGQLLFDPATLSPVTLKAGNNIIGRKSDKSSAQIQVPINNNSNLTSREHIKIEVKEVAGIGIVHYLSLYKEKTNNTYYNNKLMKFGDCFILKNGDIIKLPDFTITFVLPDKNDTIYEGEN